MVAGAHGYNSSFGAALARRDWPETRGKLPEGSTSLVEVVPGAHSTRRVHPLRAAGPRCTRRSPRPSGTGNRSLPVRRSITLQPMTALDLRAAALRARPGGFGSMVPPVAILWPAGLGGTTGPQILRNRLFRAGALSGRDIDAVHRTSSRLRTLPLSAWEMEVGGDVPGWMVRRRLESGRRVQEPQKHCPRKPGVRAPARLRANSASATGGNRVSLRASGHDHGITAARNEPRRRLPPPRPRTVPPAVARRVAALRPPRLLRDQARRPRRMAVAAGETGEHGAASGAGRLVDPRMEG